MFNDLMKMWSKMSNLERLFIVAAILVILCSICSDCMICTGVKSVLNMESFQSMDGGKPALVLYYAPWCGHCKNFMPEWNKLSQNIGNNGSVDVKKVDCDANPEEAEQNDVDGFPTVVLHKDSNSIKYEGERSEEAIMKWINSQVFNN